MKNTYLTPGPSQLYFTAEYHLKQALKNGVPSISHRSKEFRYIYQSIKENLPLLLNLPADYRIFFTSSATEVWERISQNLVSHNSFHLSNGAFADKFLNIMQANGKNTDVVKMPGGQPFEIDHIKIPDNNELIAITQNETSTGTRFPLEDIYELRHKFPDQLIAVDAVSSIPYENIDYANIDTLYFSVQHCFGLPAGLGVWLVNERCINKAFELQGEKSAEGPSRSIPHLLKMYEQDQTPETPNIIGIYLLSKVIEDMLQKGIDQIRREINYKAALAYHGMSEQGFLGPFVKSENIRSKTIITIESDYTEDIYTYFLSKGIVLGKGYGSFENTHLRISNFPTHSKEFFEKFADYLTAFQPVNS